MYNAKTLIRDTLVDNATIKGYFSAAATGSCHVTMEHIQVSAVYPQITIGWIGGQTTPGMDADEAFVYLTVTTLGSGSLHPFKELGKFRSTIISLLDDTNLSATATIYHMRKENEFEMYDDDTKVYGLKMGFLLKTKQSSTIP
jgi:hypothetical protein